MSKIKKIYAQKEELIQYLTDKPEITKIVIREEDPIYPIILIHGYEAWPSIWDVFIPFFGMNGYVLGKNLFCLDLRGISGLANGDIKEYAADLAYMIEKIKFNKKISKVNVIVHSMGGLVTRWYIEQMDGSKDINKLIMLGTPNHGSIYLPLIIRITQSYDNILRKIDNSAISLNQLSYKILTKKEEGNEKRKDKLKEKLKILLEKQKMDNSGIAAIQMTPESEFLTILGYKGRSNYYIIIGTKGFPGIIPGGLNDGAVPASSVELENLPEKNKAIFNATHLQLHLKYQIFNKIMQFIYAKI